MILLVSVIGCYPLAAHPTRVANGGALNMTAGGQVVRVKPDSGTSHVTFIPNVSLQLVVGARDSLRTDAVSTRFSFGAGLSGFGWGAYAEFPEDFLGETDAGVGVSGQYGSVFTTVMPYFQFGRRVGANGSWLVSQGVAMVSTNDSLGWSPLSATTFGVSAERSWLSGVMFFTVLTGNRSFEYECGICISRGVMGRSFILFGVSNSFTRGPSLTIRRGR
jgi:hypothetical protein